MLNSCLDKRMKFYSWRINCQDSSLEEETACLAAFLDFYSGGEQRSKSDLNRTTRSENKECKSGIYLYIGASASSLYQITRWSLSPGTGGSTSHGNWAVPPATASASIIVTVMTKTGCESGTSYDESKAWLQFVSNRLA